MTAASLRHGARTVCQHSEYAQPSGLHTLAQIPGNTLALSHSDALDMVQGLASHVASHSQAAQHGQRVALMLSATVLHPILDKLPFGRNSMDDFGAPCPAGQNPTEVAAEKHKQRCWRRPGAYGRLAGRQPRAGRKTRCIRKRARASKTTNASPSPWAPFSRTSLSQRGVFLHPGCLSRPARGTRGASKRSSQHLARAAAIRSALPHHRFRPTQRDQSAVKFHLRGRVEKAGRSFP
jgi:hypothetical protein